MASAKEIPPGGEGSIDVTFKVGSRKGKRSKTISVTTNDPAQKTVKLKVSAEVEILFDAKPKRVNFGRFKKDEGGLTKFVSFTGRDKDSTHIISAESKKGFVTVEMNPDGYENDTYKKIKVSLPPGIKVGRFRDTITVKTDHEKANKIRIFVYGEVMGSIKVSPSYLSLGLIENGKSVEKSIKLTATSGAGFKILDVRSTLSELATTVETITEGKEYKVNISLKDAVQKDILKGKIIVTTDDNEQKNIEVKVFGRVRKKS